MAEQAETGKQPDPIPRFEIPDAWASSGHCPACGAAPLKASHFPDLPDFLVCSQCELTFEVAANAGLMRVKNFPEKLEFAEEDLRYRWVAPSVVRHFYQDREALIREKARVAALAELSDEEVWNRAFALNRLGNEPWVIKQVLVQAGASQAQAEAALRKLKIWSAQNSKRQTQKLWWVGGSAAVLVIALLGGWMTILNRINTVLVQEKKEQADAPLLPLEILEALPDPVKPGFLKAPPAYVEQVGPESARCPVSPTDAANLFGGQAEMWKAGSQPDSWQMLNPGDPATLRLPAGMYAGYIDNETFVLRNANGPATIHNVNFIVVSCF
jgi:hypothetical protein